MTFEMQYISCQIGNHFRYKFRKNCLKHMTVIYVIEGCPWKVTTCVVGRTKIVQVHTFINELNHSLEDVSVSKPIVHCNQATTMIDNVICSNPNYLSRQICKDFHRQYKMQLNYCQAWNLKEKAKEQNHGVPQCSYKLLPWLCTRLIETNPGTIAEYKCSDDGHLMQLFVALSVSLHGFKMGCRPIISTDSSHMSESYKGALFLASSYDANNVMFPLAYCLFNSKN